MIVGHRGESLMGILVEADQRPRFLVAEGVGQLRLVAQQRQASCALLLRAGQTLHSTQEQQPCRASPTGYSTLSHHLCSGDLLSLVVIKKQLSRCSPSVHETGIHSHTQISCTLLPCIGISKTLSHLGSRLQPQTHAPPQSCTISSTVNSHHIQSFLSSP